MTTPAAAPRDEVEALAEKVYEAYWGNADHPAWDYRVHGKSDWRRIATMILSTYTPRAASEWEEAREACLQLCDEADVCGPAGMSLLMDKIRALTRPVAPAPEAVLRRAAGDYYVQAVRHDQGHTDGTFAQDNNARVTSLRLKSAAEDVLSAAEVEYARHLTRPTPAPSAPAADDFKPEEVIEGIVLPEYVEEFIDTLKTACKTDCGWRARDIATNALRNSIRRAIYEAEQFVRKEPRV